MASKISKYVFADGSVGTHEEIEDRQIWRNAAGRLHSDADCPAMVSSNARFWFRDGEFHRDGNRPAIILSTGQCFYYVNGEYIGEGFIPGRQG